MALDIESTIKTVKKDLKTAATARTKAAEAIATADANEAKAWATLYALPGVGPEFAAALTGQPLAKCQDEFENTQKLG